MRADDVAFDEIILVRNAGTGHGAACHAGVSGTEEIDGSSCVVDRNQNGLTVGAGQGAGGLKDVGDRARFTAGIVAIDASDDRWGGKSSERSQNDYDDHEFEK